VTAVFRLLFNARHARGDGHPGLSAGRFLDSAKASLRVLHAQEWRLAYAKKPPALE